MAKGRNSVVISIRLPENAAALLKSRAASKGIGYTVLAKQLLLQKLGLGQFVVPGR